jgi:hypothetical protein
MACTSSSVCKIGRSYLVSERLYSEVLGTTSSGTSSMNRSRGSYTSPSRTNTLKEGGCAVGMADR